MFWKIGDHLAIRQAEQKKNEGEESPYFSEIWFSILKKLMFFSNDEHSEVRHSAIHTLSNLIVHHGNILGYDTKMLN